MLETSPMTVDDDEKSLSEQLREENKEEEEENEDENQEGIKANLPTFDANEFKIRKTKK